MSQYFKKIKLQTKNQFEIVDISSEVKAVIADSGAKNGIVVLFCPHTTAGVRLNHFEPLLLQDILRAMYRLVPQDISYNHDLFELRENALANERSNGHAHVKAFLLGSSENLILENGQLLLGDRQSICFVELDGGRSREVYIKIMSS